MLRVSFTCKFNELLEIVPTIDTKTLKKFEDGNGGFEKAIDLDIESEYATFVDRYGRKGIIIKTDKGNVIIYQRWVDVDTIVNCHYPETLQELLGNDNYITEFTYTHMLPVVINGEIQSDTRFKLQLRELD